MKYLFDFYGVLLRGHSPAARAELERVVGATDTVRFWEIFEELRPAFDAGLVSEERWWEQVRVRAGLPRFDIGEAVAADFDPCTEPITETVELALELVDAGATVGALSNIPLGLARRVRARHAWLDDFAAVTLSCDIGVAKPDRRAYEVAVDALGGGAKDTLFIDDRADYIAGAAQAGLRTHLYTGVADLRAALADLRA